MAVDRERVAALVRELLEAIGEDPERPGLRLTPGRVADAYAEFFAGVGAGCRRPARAHDLGRARAGARDAAVGRGHAARHRASAPSASITCCRSADAPTSPTSPASRSSGSARCRRSSRSSRRARRCRSASASRSPTRSRHPSTPAACWWCSTPSHECVTMRGDRQPRCLDRHDRRARRTRRAGRARGADRADRGDHADDDAHHGDRQRDPRLVQRRRAVRRPRRRHRARSAAARGGRASARRRRRVDAPGRRARRRRASSRSACCPSSGRSPRRAPSSASTR